MPQGIHVAQVPIDAAVGWTQEDGTRAHRLAGTTVDDNMADPGKPICSCTASIGRLGRLKSSYDRGSRSGDQYLSFSSDDDVAFIRDHDALGDARPQLPVSFSADWGRPFKESWILCSS